MKTIEQLLELSKNQYYIMTIEERSALDAFLFKQSALKNRQRSNGNISEKNIPATVLNKNIVKKEMGEIPTVDNVVSPDDKD